MSDTRDRDFAPLMRDVAQKLLGEPNKKTKTEMRWGRQGSLAVDLEKGAYFDHEAHEGGGVLDLIKRQNGLSGSDAVKWLEDNGFLQADGARRNYTPPKVNGFWIDSSGIDVRKVVSPAALDHGVYLKPWQHIVATFEYYDEHGVLAYRNHRIEPGDNGSNKTFRRDYPAENGGWKSKADGVQSVPYRLPELLTSDGPVYLAEGEAQADKLSLWGYTSSSLKDWSGDFAKTLKGRIVYILPDNDEAGQKQAMKAREKLEEAGSQVFIVELPNLPEKGDILDWYGTNDDFSRIVARVSVAAKPKRAFAFTRVSDLELKDPEFLIQDMVETETLGQIFGNPGEGKSFIAVELAACVATGTPFFEKPTKQGSVFFIAGEGHNGLARRFAAWAKDRDVSLADAPLFKSNRAAQFLDKESAKEVEQAIDALASENGSPSLVIIDTLARNFGAGDENSTQDMSGFISAIDDLRYKFPGCCLVLVHHSGHQDKGRARGSIALKGAIDFEYKVSKRGNQVTFENTKMKEAEPPKPVFLEFRSVPLGGEKSSAVLVQHKGEVGEEKPLSPTQKMAMESFVSASAKYGDFDENGFSGLHLDDWRDEYYAMHTGDNQDSKKKAFQRARKVLVDAKILSVDDDYYAPNDEKYVLQIVFKKDGAGQ